MSQIRLERSVGGYLIVASDGRDVLIQTDWDYPGVASSFGWSVKDVQREHRSKGIRNQEPCDHEQTDGTVKCPDCLLLATEFICAAQNWLDDNIGAVAEDPGYFGG